MISGSRRRFLSGTVATLLGAIGSTLGIGALLSLLFAAALAPRAVRA
jgi:hypothetical protein